MESTTPETAHHLSWPSISQFSVFLPNRVGELLRMMRALEDEEVKIVALSAVDSVDCSIIRVVVDKPWIARQVFTDHQYATNESELVAVELPDDPQPLIAICRALLGAESNIYNVISLMPHFHGHPAVALQVDDVPSAIRVLQRAGFHVISEAEMDDPDSPRFQDN